MSEQRNKTGCFWDIINSVAKIIDWDLSRFSGTPKKTDNYILCLNTNNKIINLPNPFLPIKEKRHQDFVGVWRLKNLKK